MSNGIPIDHESLEKAIKDGRLPNRIIFHHFKEIATCGHIIDQALGKCEELGYHPIEIYYAFLEHLYSMRFAFEDLNQEEILKLIDTEVVKDQMKHRKKYTKEAMHKGEFKLPSWYHPTEGGE